MESQPASDLNGLFAAWRGHMAERGVTDEATLDELESHLRDEVDRLQEKGLPERQAFFEACIRLGHEDALATEYRKAREIPIAKQRPLQAAAWTAALGRSYLVSAWRNLRRHRGYAFINVFGLSLGLATCIIIGLYVRHELSFDRYFPDAERTYRVYYGGEIDEGIGGVATVAPGLVQSLENRFPEVEYATQLDRPRRVSIKLGGQRMFLDDASYADEQFLKVFPFRVLRGNAEAALAAPHQIVLTRSTARRLFGLESPIGKTITVEGDEAGEESDYTVAAILEDIPSNTHFHLNALFSLDEGGRAQRHSTDIQWMFWGRGFLYVTLHPNADPGELERKIRTFEQTSRSKAGHGNTPLLRLIPLTRIHLYTSMENEIRPQSDWRYLLLFSGIGFLILIVAAVNYMNLSTARSAERAREVGVRKVVGANRGQLVGQFLGESVLLVLLALPLALIIVLLAAPLLGQMTGYPIPLRDLSSMPLISGLLGGVLLIGLVAGLYPAFFLSRFQPGMVLKARSRSLGRGGIWLWRSLIVVQFAATVILIAATLMIQLQMDYVRNRRLGFDQEQVVTLELPGRGFENQYEAFRRALLARPGIISASSGPPPGLGWMNATVSVSKTDSTDAWVLSVLEVDYGYAEVLGIKPIEGRTFDPVRDMRPEGAVLLTRSAANHLGLGQQAAGKQTSFAWIQDANVVGILDDIHNASLREAVRPMALVLKPGFNWTMLLRLRPGRIQQGLAAIEEVWNQFLPGRAFDFSFLDDQIAEQYQAEQRLGRLFGLFTGLALFLACMGLFGLAAFSAEQRTKEIGIRKALGATAGQIVLLLSKEMTWLVLAAVVIGSPIAYFATRKWLANFAYHIDLSVWLFLLCGAAALLIAFATVGFQALRRATANPVDALRYE